VVFSWGILCTQQPHPSSSSLPGGSRCMMKRIFTSCTLPWLQRPHHCPGIALAEVTARGSCTLKLHKGSAVHLMPATLLACCLVCTSSSVQPHLGQGPS